MCKRVAFTGKGWKKRNKNDLDLLPHVCPYGSWIRTHPPLEHTIASLPTTTTTRETRVFCVLIQLFFAVLQHLLIVLFSGLRAVAFTTPSDIKALFCFGHDNESVIFIRHEEEGRQKRTTQNSDRCSKLTFFSPK